MWAPGKEWLCSALKAPGSWPLAARPHSPRRLKSPRQPQPCTAADSCGEIRDQSHRVGDRKDISAPRHQLETLDYASEISAASSLSAWFLGDLSHLAVILTPDTSCRAQPTGTVQSWDCLTTRGSGKSLSESLGLCSQEP